MNVVFTLRPARDEDPDFWVKMVGEERGGRIAHKSGERLTLQLKNYKIERREVLFILEEVVRWGVMQPITDYLFDYKHEYEEGKMPIWGRDFQFMQKGISPESEAGRLLYELIVELRREFL
jgi:hypothetical protein